LHGDNFSVDFRPHADGVLEEAEFLKQESRYHTLFFSNKAAAHLMRAGPGKEYERTHLIAIGAKYDLGILQILGELTPA